MRIKRVEIENFRCLDQVIVSFDKVTTLIGPNGAGKSSVLRALDWFFNGDKSAVLTGDDVFSGAKEQKIVVRVDFNELTQSDRELLGEKYAPAKVDEFSVWRIWEDGKDKITGRALAFGPFEDVRAASGAGPKKAAYEKVAAEHNQLTFPKWTSVGAADAMLDTWEREHPELLSSAQVSDTNFFGFAGQGRLSGLFDFVLITADLRASEEAQDTKTSVIGRIIEKTVDRSAADDELSSLNEELTSRHAEISGRHFASQLRRLSADLTAEVESFAPGRSIDVGSVQAEFKPQATRFNVKVDDHGTKTNIERQGHGFQRSLLIAALKLLAHRGAANRDASVIYMAIEEPELFQHPTQAKAFATVLRSLAEDKASGIQVGYATHSPYFIEPTYFDQVRRVQRSADASAGPQVIVYEASMDAVVKELDTFLEESAVRSRLDNACLHELRDAMFASAVLLVEGTTDRAIIEGVAEADAPLSSLGVEVAVATSKGQILLPAAILRRLGVPHFILFDADKDSGRRVRAKGKPEAVAIAQEQKDSRDNRTMLRFLGEPETDWPSGFCGTAAWAMEDMLETFVAAKWPQFEIERQALVDAGRGADGKNAATYRIASRSAGSRPSDLTTIISHVSSMAV
ncbi:AAA family ATPase [Pseudarthrobacter psychrotolerans]|uniref:AAA family ATPase n=1 Tax=Pseudarthrobacter psychrotolerans TaxID=2697569 RepID=A0A6P1NE96_9MICC|nr:AAA family ATPase [Pseudarthrobacter psychrotolerans]